MSNQSAIARVIDTDRPNYQVKVSVMYIQRRGYFASVYASKQDGLFEASPLLGPGTYRMKLEDSQRFNAKTLQKIVTAVQHNEYSSLEDAIARVLDEVPSLNY